MPWMCNGWTLQDRLGKGGNGEVWLAENDVGEQCAIKLLNKIKPIAYQRFKSEVAVMRDNALPGVVPIIEEHLPAQFSNSRPWYAMPVGERMPLVASPDQVPACVASVAAIAQTMATLHEREIAHRDIKPANLIVIEGKACIGDFGLASFPGKQRLTNSKERIGPRLSMAPEVSRFGRKADPFAADVYSMGKTLWMLLSGDVNGFDGQYAPESAVSIARVLRNYFGDPIESLLQRATDHSIANRPSMKEFANELIEWLRLQPRFSERNKLEWLVVQSQLFPVKVPERAQWTSPDAIVAVLNRVAKKSNMNHMFLPGGGGLDLDSVVRTDLEDGCILIFANNLELLARPARLMFESFGTDGLWDYFRLELQELQPSGLSELPDQEKREEVVALGAGNFAPPWSWEDGDYKGRKFPEDAVYVTRFLRGAFVIFRKASIYNSAAGTYDGRHSEMDADTFRAHIGAAARHRDVARSL